MLIFYFTEGFVLLWKKGEDIIAVGKQLINREDKRLQVKIYFKQFT